MNVKFQDIKKGTLLQSDKNNMFLVSSISITGDTVTINGAGDHNRVSIIVNTYYGSLLGWRIVKR